MSITKEVTLWCDRCGDWDQITGTVRQIRAGAKKKGWTAKRENDSKLRDYCRRCSTPIPPLPKQEESC